MNAQGNSALHMLARETGRKYDDLYAEYHGTMQFWGDDELTAKQTARIQRIRAERANRKIICEECFECWDCEEVPYLEEDMGECPKCDCAVRRCDLAWRANDEDNINIGYYLDICRKCDEEEDDDDDDNDCICESNENPNPLCPDHQCCWACSTQSVPITLNEHSRLWLCDECDDKGKWCRHSRKTL